MKYVISRIFTKFFRRSLFNNAERGKFLNQLVAGVRDILQNPSGEWSHEIYDVCVNSRIFSVFLGLTDPNNYHEFCRLLARLKSNYQLGELVMVDQYPESIQLMAKFTVEVISRNFWWKIVISRNFPTFQSLQMWQFAPNSIHYLLSLWQRMVSLISRNFHENYDFTKFFRLHLCLMWKLLNPIY